MLIICRESTSANAIQTLTELSPMAKAGLVAGPMGMLIYKLKQREFEFTKQYKLAKKQCKKLEDAQRDMCMRRAMQKYYNQMATANQQAAMQLKGKDDKKYLQTLVKAQYYKKVAQNLMNKNIPITQAVPLAKQQTEVFRKQMKLKLKQMKKMRNK